MDTDYIKKKITETTGLSIEVREDEQSPERKCVISSSDLPSNMGFQLSSELTWKRVRVSFLLETFSGNLLESISNADKSKIEEFVQTCSSFSNHGEIILRINNIEQDYSSPSTWPDNLRNFEMDLISKPISSGVDLGFSPKSDEYLVAWVEKMLAIVFPLLPIEEVDTDTEHSIGEEEGIQYSVKINRYERSMKNRLICISYHGKKCSVCGFNFSDFYGEIGEGYIHVHHLKPLSSLETSYRIDPINDLIPVCPNCHAMIHTESPPISPDSLRSIISDNL